jgi:UDP-N-acetyl-D-galactosamine dehydrogenase
MKGRYHMERKIAIIGLGYVGLPVALAFAREYRNVIGFDINTEKVKELLGRYDRTGETSKEELEKTSLTFTAEVSDLKDRDFFIVAVPTPVDQAHRPDLTAIRKASETVGTVIKKGAIVVYESTVYPGVTEDICGPILARVSGLRQGVDFKLGYSPERINPGDKLHRLENIVKVISGEDRETLEIISKVYSEVIIAGIYQAPSIKVAEAAKVIENTQRDLNIALMNELAIIFDKLNINTLEVLEAAGTKWNFLHFYPGLVGGHCIGVDPYYLTYKAEEIGYHPQVILAGRRINDNMGKYVAEETVKKMIRAGKNIVSAKIGILGLTFKEDVPDLRNSRVPDIITELQDYCGNILVHDPLGNSEEAEKEYGIKLVQWDDLRDLDVIVLAVGHQYYKNKNLDEILAKLKVRDKGVLIDVKSLYKAADVPDNIVYWSL